MKTTVDNYDFRNAFEKMNRASNFSYSGLDTLFEMLEEFEESTGTEIEFDVIAICCQFNELTIDELLNDYGFVKEYFSAGWETLDTDTKKELTESALDSRGAYYRWIDENSLILDVESF